MVHSLVSPALVALAALIAAPLAAQPATPAPDARHRALAERVLQRTPLIDGHNDWPWALRARYGEEALRAPLDRSDAPIQTDVERLRAGRVGAQLWSVYLPQTFTGAEAVRATLEQIDLVHEMIRRSPHLALALTADDLEAHHRAGRIGGLITVEGGHQFGERMAVLRMYQRLGVRSMTLTHNSANAFVDSATDAPRHNGLSEAGRAVIGEMNRLGMLVDLAHVSPQAMHAVLEVSRAPVAFTHSSARALTDHPRNVPDDVLARVRDNGGIVMVTYVGSFVSQDALDWFSRRMGERERLDRRFPGQPERRDAELAQWDGANPRPLATLAQVADHIEHVARVAGHAHVGIGGDFDGTFPLPVGLEDVSTYPALLAELARRGWMESQLRDLAGRNFLRVLRANEAVARSLSALPPAIVSFAPATAP